MLCVLLVVAAAGCSRKGKVLGKIRDSLAKNNYDETMVLCEHALRKGVQDGEVYYYYGVALIEVGRDYESFRRFHEAVARDSTLAGRVAARLLQKGKTAIEKGQKRAANRLRQAADFDPGIELGVYKYAVAEAYFDEKAFAQAASFYRSAVVDWPDTSAAEKAYFNLSQCYLAMADSTEAIAALEEELSRYPKGVLSGRARYKLINLLYASAQAEFGRGNYETVVEQTTALLERTDNRSFVQRARFLLGEAYERMGDYENAYAQYKAIIDKDRGASGRIVEKAREKITAFRDSGLI
ncbi:MAG: tetratricopeptide repeat protein [Candidatus Krumholzibacteriia bacterium]